MSASTLSHGRPTGRGNHPRLPSTPLYTLFSPPQIQQFREAFNLIDSNSDGLISASDLALTLSNLGLPSSGLSAALASLYDLPTNGTDGKEGGITFTVFLSMMGDKLLKLDPEEELNEAFGSFDEGDEGVVRVEEMREWLRESGERMSEEEINKLFSSRFTDKRKGLFNYREFSKSLKVNDPEPENERASQQA
ncbi:hypothetical protein BDY24DRAFT_375731 [Mrakia frigida]|uniref:uncharacterized protein n=1 Tax=Mrakia frigida TaxID=29902 RepID=UPI003FCC09C2